MDIRTLRSFVKTAAELRLGSEELPVDYFSVREAVLDKFPKLAALPLGHAAEVAGLGVLAAPSVQEMRGKPMSDTKKSMYEIGGLGVLAAPSAYHLYKHFRP